MDKAFFKSWYIFKIVFVEVFENVSIDFKISDKGIF